jgi:hypothetical protein
VCTTVTVHYPVLLSTLCCIVAGWVSSPRSRPPVMSSLLSQAFPHCPQYPRCVDWAVDGNIVLFASQCVYVMCPVLGKGDLFDVRFAEVEYISKQEAAESTGKHHKGKSSGVSNMSTKNELPYADVDSYDLIHWLERSDGTSSAQFDRGVEFCGADLCPSHVSSVDGPLVVLRVTNGCCLLARIDSHASCGTYSLAGEKLARVRTSGLTIIADIGKDFLAWRLKCTKSAAYGDSSPKPSSSSSSSSAASTAGIFGKNCCGNCVRQLQWLPVKISTGNYENCSAFVAASGCMLSIWIVPSAASFGKVICVAQLFTCPHADCHKYSTSNRMDINQCCYEHCINSLFVCSGSDNCVTISYASAEGDVGCGIFDPQTAELRSHWHKLASGSTALPMSVVFCDTDFGVMVYISSEVLFIIGINKDGLDSGLQDSSQIRIQLPAIICCVERSSRPSADILNLLVTLVDGPPRILSLRKDHTTAPVASSYNDAAHDYSCRLSLKCKLHARLEPVTVPQTDGDDDDRNKSEISKLMARVFSASNSKDIEGIESPDNTLIATCLDPLRLLRIVVKVRPGAITNARDEQLSVFLQKNHGIFSLEIAPLLENHYSANPGNSATANQGDDYGNAQYRLSPKWLLDDVEVREFFGRIIQQSDAASSSSSKHQHYAAACLGLMSVSCCFLLSADYCKQTQAEIPAGVAALDDSECDLDHADDDRGDGYAAAQTEDDDAPMILDNENVAAPVSMPVITVKDEAELSPTKSSRKRSNKLTAIPLSESGIIEVSELDLLASMNGISAADPKSTPNPTKVYRKRTTTTVPRKPHKGTSGSRTLASMMTSFSDKEQGVEYIVDGLELVLAVAVDLFADRDDWLTGTKGMCYIIK